MSCEHVERDLDTYLDNELDPATALDVRGHLNECAACHRRVAEREALGRLVRAAPYYSAPDRLRARVLAQTTRARSVRRLLTWAAAAVLFVSLGGGMSLWRSADSSGLRHITRLRTVCGHECWHRPLDPSRCAASSHGRPQQYWSSRSAAE